MSWLGQRFPNLTKLQLQAMIKLADPSKSIALRELREEGILIGEARGEARGMHDMCLRQATKKFGPLSAKIVTAVDGLDYMQLEDLGDAILDLHSASELRAWLAAQKKK